MAYGAELIAVTCFHLVALVGTLGTSVSIGLSSKGTRSSSVIGWLILAVAGIHTSTASVYYVICDLHSECICRVLACVTREDSQELKNPDKMSSSLEVHLLSRAVVAHNL